MARPAGFEPATYGLEVRCSILAELRAHQGFQETITFLCVTLSETILRMPTRAQQAPESRIGLYCSPHPAAFEVKDASDLWKREKT